MVISPAAELEAELETKAAQIPSPSALVSSPVILRLKLLPPTLRIESTGILWSSSSTGTLPNRAQRAAFYALP
ncbi:MAG: hypothetical protein O3A75_10090 [Verrucomicrobia bacterium]|nr:hypothetical protein [Verrucomicrobiota bacterium]MDA1204633.1 hypothetical protein [Verrucomicrobiota bacterium]